MIGEPVDLHCIGGFALTMQYGVSRPTADVDVLVASAPPHKLETLQRLGGKTSALHERFKVYLQPVAVAPYPEDYESRLIQMWPDFDLAHLRLFVLEAHDLALTKIDRNSEVDRQDISDLARIGAINSDTLRKRYLEELRPNFVGRVERIDTTLEIWVEIIDEIAKESG